MQGLMIVVTFKFYINYLYIFVCVCVCWYITQWTGHSLYYILNIFFTLFTNILLKIYLLSKKKKEIKIFWENQKKENTCASVWLKSDTVGCGFGEQRGWEDRKLGVSAYLLLRGARPSELLIYQLGISLKKVGQHNDLMRVF